MVKVPQALSARALTTTLAIAAMAIITMARMANPATMPERGPISALGNLSQRLAVPADGRRQHDEVVDRAAQHHANENPQVAGQEAELRGQRGPHQRARASDGCEVVSSKSTHLLVGT